MKVSRTGMAVPTGPTGILSSSKRGPKGGGSKPSTGRGKGLQSPRGAGSLSRGGRR